MNERDSNLRPRIIMARRHKSGAKSFGTFRSTSMPQADSRLALIQDWLTRDLHLRPDRVEPASADASFRRYFRVFNDASASTSTFIVMDAPPGKEDVRPYLKVTRLLEGMGAHVPHIHETDVDRGLLLLEDLGNTPYLSRLKAGDDPERLYGDALDILADIQVRGRDAATELPRYDREALHRELALMPEWFFTRHLKLTLSREEQQTIEDAFEFLIREALAQPQVFVHRDYHSRNLMVVADRNPGVIDFQDAMHGPLGYDLVSLLKDCYISWPRTRVERWVREYGARLESRGFLAGTDPVEFLRWFDVIGVQRHIKVLGIFARLWYRDGKSAYLHDLPLTLDYVLDTCARYPELEKLSKFMTTRVAPELQPANVRETA